jgi:hypothetical protein
MTHFRRHNNIATQKMRRAQEEEEAELEEYRRRRADYERDTPTSTRRALFHNPRCRRYWK